MVWNPILIFTAHVEVATVTLVALDSASLKPPLASPLPQFPLKGDQPRDQQSLLQDFVNCSRTQLPQSTIVKMAKTTTLKEFESVFPKLVEDILDDARKYNLPQAFVEWFKAVGSSLRGSAINLLTSAKVPSCQYDRREMQPWNVCPRLSLHDPRGSTIRTTVLRSCNTGMDD